MSSSIRLSNEEIDSIKAIFQTCFKPGDGLWIFGSRVDPLARGGDIDLYIETRLSTAEEVNEARLKFLTALKLKIGDQKIDVVVKFGDKILPIYEIATAQGIKLV